jgi:hypothetical protein
MNSELTSWTGIAAQRSRVGICQAVRLCEPRSLNAMMCWLGVEPAACASSVIKASAGHLLAHRSDGWLWLPHDETPLRDSPLDVLLFDTGDGMDRIELSGMHTSRLLDALGPVSDALAQRATRSPVGPAGVCTRLLLSQILVLVWARDDGYTLLLERSVGEWFWRALTLAAAGVSATMDAQT